MVGIGVMAWGLVVSFDRPIGKVEVGGQFQRVAPLQIEEVVAPFRGSGFLSVDLDALRAALETIPWVDRARVERKWPNGVRVFITEHVAAARWGDSGLMNTRGELFLDRRQAHSAGVAATGRSAGHGDQVAKLYLESYPRLLGVGMRLSQSRAGCARCVAADAWPMASACVWVDRTCPRAWKDSLLSRARSSPLALAEVSYVDLRYSNGFSVGWNVPTRVARDAEDARPDA